MDKLYDVGYRALIHTRKKHAFDANTRVWNTIKVQTSPEWFGHRNSKGGGLGFYPTISELKDSIRAYGFSRNQYEIWKFHVGLPTSEVPWFPPEKVNE